MKSLKNAPIKDAQRFKDLFFPFIQQIQSKWKLYALILFGSRARGDFIPCSDYDIIIIADFTESYFKRGDQLLAILPPVAIDFLTYTPSEFRQMFLEGHLTAIDAIREGIALFDADFLHPFLRKYELLEKMGIKVNQCTLSLPELPEHEKSIDSFF
jgi:hypothetical protein